MSRERILKSTPLWVLAGLLTSCAFRAPDIATYGPPPDRRMIQNVHIVDVEQGTIIKNQDLWIRRGRIEAIVPTGDIEPESISQVFPAKGRYVMPGMIDGHVHIEGNIAPPWAFELPDIRGNMERLLYSGITTIIDMGGALGKLEQARGFVEDGRYNGPDLFFSGPAITAIDGHPSQLSMFLKWPFKKIARAHIAAEVDNREGVQDALEEIKRKNGFLAKFSLDEIPVGAPKIDEELLKYGIKRAHAMGMLVAVHIGTNAEAQLAVELGADILTHSVYREKINEDTIADIKANRVKVIPTLGVFKRLEAVYEQQPVEWAPLEKELSDPEVLAAAFERPSSEEFLMPAPFAAYMNRIKGQQEMRDLNVWTLREAGVEIIVGSDAPSVGWQSGAALHEEIKLLADVGYTPAELVKAVTIGNAKHFDFKDRGLLEPQMRADLLVLNANPLESIDAFADIEAVFVKGSKVARKGLTP